MSKFKVGDKVRAVQECSTLILRVPVGTVGVIEELTAEDRAACAMFKISDVIRVRFAPGAEGHVIGKPEYVELVAEEKVEPETEAAAPSVEPVRFKIGDRVRAKADIKFGDGVVIFAGTSCTVKSANFFLVEIEADGGDGMRHCSPVEIEPVEAGAAKSEGVEAKLETAAPPEPVPLARMEVGQRVRVRTSGSRGVVEIVCGVLGDCGHVRLANGRHHFRRGDLTLDEGTVPNWKDEKAATETVTTPTRNEIFTAAENAIDDAFDDYNKAITKIMAVYDNLDDRLTIGDQKYLLKYGASRYDEADEDFDTFDNVDR